jgi:hypothetical protein
VRVEHDPDVLLRLILGETRACRDRPRHRLVEVSVDRPGVRIVLS